MSFNDKINRRTALIGLGGLAVALGTNASLEAQAAEQCEGKVRRKIKPEYDEALKDLPIIDVHCHIFNANDVPVHQYLRNRVKELVDYNELWTDAANETLKAMTPDAFPMLAVAPSNILEEASLHLLKASSKTPWKVDKKHKNKLKQLLNNDSNVHAAFNEMFPGKDNPDSLSQFILERILPLRKDYLGTDKTFNDLYFDELFPIKSLDEVNWLVELLGATEAKDLFRGLFRLAWHLSRSRARNFQDIRRLYGISSEKMDGAKVVLFTPALVDFDYWLDADSIPDRQAYAVCEHSEDNEHIELERRKDPCHMQTSMTDQIMLMADLMRVYPGEIHPFVPFCPWRQIDDEYRGVAEAKSALGIVKWAIEERGFVGVKLYPPMGFAPMRNEYLYDVTDNPDIKLEDRHPKHLWRNKERYAYWKNFGKGLDLAMDALFTYCVNNDVPIMAHTAYGNSAGFRSDFADEESPRGVSTAEQATPFYWQHLLEQSRYKNLRINFGHLAFLGLDHSGRDKSTDWVNCIGLYMDKLKNVYADLSYETEILKNKNKSCDEAAARFGKRLNKEFLEKPPYETLKHTVDNEEIICYSSSSRSKLLPSEPRPAHSKNNRQDRIMYGTDWHLIVREPFYMHYLTTNARQFMNQSGNAVMLKKFLAGNACNFLGLAKKDGIKPLTRQRLEKYYAREIGWSQDIIDNYFRKFDKLTAELHYAPFK